MAHKNAMRFVTRFDLGILGQPDNEQLWTEVLSNISDAVLLKPDVKILCVACGHGTEARILFKRMLALGIPRAKVQESIWVLDKYKWFVDSIRLSSGITNVIAENFLTWQTDMKFDFIVGNPPYSEVRKHGGTNSNSLILYDKFIYKASELAEQVALVVPGGWTAKQREVDKILNHGLSDVHFYPGNVFENVAIRSGITVVFLKRNYQGPLGIRTESDKKFSQSRYASIVNAPPEEKNLLSRVGELPNAVSWVHKSEISYPKGTRGILSRVLENASDLISLEKTPRHTTPTLVLLNGSKDPIFGFTSIQSKHAPFTKLAFPAIPGIRTVGRSVIIPEGCATAACHVMLFKTPAQAELAKAFFDGPLVKFIVSRTKFNDILTTFNNTWRHVPAPPLTEWEARGIEPTIEAVLAATIEWLELTDTEVSLISEH